MTISLAGKPSGVGMDVRARMDHNPSILIVTGSHLSAEKLDRPLAYYARQRLITMLRNDRPCDDSAVLVCSDLWYLNKDDLRGVPTLSVGGPRENALTAMLADKLPSVYVVEGELIVQAESGFDPPLVACWGEGNGTSRAVEVFCERYARAFCDAVCRLSRTADTGGVGRLD